MPDVIFARPRWEYQSYSDLWRLVELSAYPLIYMDEINFQSDNCYIFSTPATDWHHGWADTKARLIYYNIEWYLNVDYRTIPGVEVWSADKWYAERIDAQYVPMGSHVSLNPHPSARAEKKYDAATLWAGTYNRYHAEDLLRQRELSLAPNGWGEERHNILMQSRMMVCVHQQPNVYTVAPQRWALAAAYHLPIVSETLSDAGLMHDVTITTDLESIGEVAASWLQTNNIGKLAAKGEALHQLLCHEHTFKTCIERAL